MTDRISKEKRSKNMSKVKSKDTSLELKVRKYLFAKGLRYRVKNKLEGKPDIVFPGKKIAIFINGCFWHQHRCKKSKRPTTNIDFWNRKLDQNIERDKKVKKILESEGWKVIYLWECKLLKQKNIFSDVFIKEIKNG